MTPPRRGCPGPQTCLLLLLAHYPETARWGCVQGDCEVQCAGADPDEYERMIAAAEPIAREQLAQRRGDNCPRRPH